MTRLGRSIESHPLLQHSSQVALPKSRLFVEVTSPGSTTVQNGPFSWILPT